MTNSLFAPHALLARGWARNVCIEVDARGFIAAVTADGAPQGAERLVGPVMPGMPNLHSHAFQRAMAGLTAKAGSAADSFWRWRDMLYRFVERLTPDDIEAIANQLYVELLEHGYTAVAEFHYVHHDAEGRPYADATELAQRVRAAARGSGIGLTLLPVFYAHAGFGGLPPTVHQRRFVHTPDSFARLLECLHAEMRGATIERLGLAPHSLRAVAPAELRAVLAAIDEVDAAAPIHVHVAEQMKEVDDCVAWSGQRPVAWLLDHADVNARWCLIHATHMTDEEARRVAASGAVVGLCPSTEADLGDGLFNAVAYAQAGGRWGIGSDSHVCVDPFAELRLYEYGQRLAQRRRNPMGAQEGASLGAQRYLQALAGGAQALGQPVGEIAPGMRADLVVLDADDPALAERSGNAWLDAAVFGPARRPVRDVMVAGRWQVREGRHSAREACERHYRTALRRLLA